MMMEATREINYTFTVPVRVYDYTSRQMSRLYSYLLKCRMKKNPAVFMPDLTPGLKLYLTSRKPSSFRQNVMYYPVHYSIHAAVITASHVCTQINCDQFCLISILTRCFLPLSRDLCKRPFIFTSVSV